MHAEFQNVSHPVELAALYMGRQSELLLLLLKIVAAAAAGELLLDDAHYYYAAYCDPLVLVVDPCCQERVVDYLGFGWNLHQTMQRK
jgi:hypothetical protein